VVDILHGLCDAKPGTGILGEQGIAGLEQNFDSIKRCDDGFGLQKKLANAAYEWIDPIALGLHSQQIRQSRPQLQISRHSPDSASYAWGSPPRRL
jgi:hypothetical protein